MIEKKEATRGKMYSCKALILDLPPFHHHHHQSSYLIIRLLLVLPWFLMLHGGTGTPT